MIGYTWDTETSNWKCVSELKNWVFCWRASCNPHLNTVPPIKVDESRSFSVLSKSTLVETVEIEFHEHKKLICPCFNLM